MDYIDKNIYEDTVIELENNLIPFKIYYSILSKWLINKSNNKEINCYLKRNNLNNIVIYGMGTLGEILYKDLENKINIVFTVDNSLDTYKVENFNSIMCKELDINISVDLIIITPVYAKDAIKDDLLNIYKEKNINILGIDDIVNIIFEESL